jgi:hypothetical protein
MSAGYDGEMSGDWPSLAYDDWKDTYATLHMWSQVVGKVALAHGPALNHCWGAALHVTSRGLTTSVLSHGHRHFTIHFDLVAHHLGIAVSDGSTRVIPLRPRSVADFYADVMTALRDMGLPVRIWSLPSEIESPIRFEDDTVHHAYDPAAANRLLHVLLRVERVLEASRTSFIGKASPSNFFWGSFDLALTRFSGRPAPPREGPAFMREAYSHEVISHGFWPGGRSVLEPVFYAYAVPEPPGFKDASVQPDAAFYHAEMGEFLLPYDAVRRAAAPEDALRAFIDSTYAAGATLAGWDRPALERAGAPVSA